MASVPADKKNLRWLYGELPLWREKGWIAPEAEAAIRAHYGPPPEDGVRRLTPILLSVLAALLVGGGIILLFAHNWDDLSRPVRAVLSVLPLLVSYAVALYVLLRQRGSAAWREGVASANVAACAAAVALVAQTYNIPGDLESYLLYVSLLALPAVYLFDSVAAAWLYLVGIVILRLTGLDWPRAVPDWEWLRFWGMWALLLPMAALRIRRGPTPGARLLVFGLLLAAGFCLVPETAKLLDICAAYVLFLGAVVGLAAWEGFAGYVFHFVPRLALTAFLVFLLILGFGDNWPSATANNSWADGWQAWILLALLAAACAFFFAAALRRRDGFAMVWTGLSLALAVLCASMHDPAIRDVPATLVNVLGLAAGAATMVLGYRQGRMLRLNGGLTVVGGILFMRFVDSDLPMVVRGVGFILLGTAFLYVNLRLSRSLKGGRS
jgi:hypothetical protein